MSLVSGLRTELWVQFTGFLNHDGTSLYTGFCVGDTSSYNIVSEILSSVSYYGEDDDHVCVKIVSSNLY